MEFQKIHNKGQAQLFKNNYLEYLTKTHPLVIWGMYLPVLILLPYYSFNSLSFDWIKVVLVFLGGMFFWSFFEYIMHRFVFHYVAESERGKKINYILHGNHHEYPRDKERLFMPAAPSLIISSVLFLLMYLVLGKNVFPFFPGFMFGYLIYGSMHYAIHAWNPPFKWMKGLWRNHHLHHYKQQQKGFGVSSTLWDHVFGTMFDLKNIKDDKEKVQELMYK
ncbi:sterol desaturase family protein [Ferruginibacter lapsinanis]|uniref:sterol desaturase family protein n=1 Tax=Ferruginibacter lapsinanis TaxID=563172 RepID=UPI001E4F1026|nr:sterol desaturase family protein [Ferruginibacter lapsinanis]UEG50941.1 sterol desaturase family protein [Ferruginibacter lapsinanis]